MKCFVPNRKPRFFFGLGSVRVWVRFETISFGSGSVPVKIPVRVRFSVWVQVQFDTLVLSIIILFTSFDSFFFGGLACFVLGLRRGMSGTRDDPFPLGTVAFRCICACAPWPEKKMAACAPCFFALVSECRDCSGARPRYDGPGKVLPRRFWVYHEHDYPYWMSVQNASCRSNKPRLKEGTWPVCTVPVPVPLVFKVFHFLCTRPKVVLHF